MKYDGGGGCDVTMHGRDNNIDDNDNEDKEVARGSDKHLRLILAHIIVFIVD